MAAVLLKPQYRAAAAVVIGASPGLPLSLAGDGRACAIARSSSWRTSRISARKSASSVMCYCTAGLEGRRQPWIRPCSGFTKQVPSFALHPRPAHVARSRRLPAWASL
jgi:hypothetical protein